MHSTLLSEILTTSTGQQLFGAFRLLKTINHTNKSQITSSQTSSNNRHRVSLSLHEAFHHARTAEVTDQRDRVYGLLGILDPQLANGIAVDYCGTVLDTYWSFSRAIIIYENGLDWLFNECIHNTAAYSESWPSWIPDLRQQVPRLSEPERKRLDLIDLDHSSHERLIRIPIPLVVDFSEDYKMTIPDIRLGKLTEAILRTDHPIPQMFKFRRDENVASFLDRPAASEGLVEAKSKIHGVVWWLEHGETWSGGRRWVVSYMRQLEKDDVLCLLLGCTHLPILYRAGWVQAY
jgi:hypothetical protein